MRHIETGSVYAPEKFEVQSVALVSPDPQEIERGVVRALRESGVPEVNVMSGDGDQSSDRHYDRRLIVGPMFPHKKQIEEIKSSAHTEAVRVWNTEQPPHIPIHNRAKKLLAKARYMAEDNGHFNLPAGRLRMLGEMIALHESGIDFKLSTYSEINRQYFEDLGIDAQTVPPGYFKELGYYQGKSVDERDIDVVFLGSTNNRRGKMLHELKEQLDANSIRFEIYDGGNMGHGPLFGDKRTEVLNNSKLMVSLGRDDYDDHVFRLFLAGANGAAVLTIDELIQESATSPFIVDQDFIASNLKGAPEKIRELLDNPYVILRTATNLHNHVMSKPTSSLVSRVIR